MEEASHNVAAFLESLQDTMGLLGKVWGHYIRHGALPHRPFLVLSGRPFTIYDSGSVRSFHGCVALGLQVKGADGKEYDLSVDVLWDADRWTMQTEAWVESLAGGQDMLRQLPERTAVGLSDCMEQLSAAVGDLVRFDDLVPSASASAEPDAAPEPGRIT